MRHIFSTLALTISTPAALASGPANLQELMNNIFRFLNYLIGLIGVVAIISAGFQYVVSVGNPQKTKNALMSIIYTAIGFTIAVMARSFAELILGKVSGQPNIQSFVSEGISTFLWVIGIASLIMIIVSGILYVVSVGEPQKTRTAKDAILYSVVGLVVALIAGAGITALNTFLSTGHL